MRKNKSFKYNKYSKKFKRPRKSKGRKNNFTKFQKQKSLKAEFWWFVNKILFWLLLIIFLKIFGVSYFGSILVAIIGKITYWLVGKLMGKK